MWPCGLNATLVTERVWPSKTRTCVPLDRFHSRSVPSSPPESAVWPCGLNATLLTASVWPVSVYSGLGASQRHFGSMTLMRPRSVLLHSLTASHNRRVPSNPPERAVRPSGLNATLVTEKV